MQTSFHRVLAFPKTRTAAPLSPPQTAELTFRACARKRSGSVAVYTPRPPELGAVTSRRSNTHTRRRRSNRSRSISSAAQPAAAAGSGIWTSLDSRANFPPRAPPLEREPGTGAFTSPPSGAPELSVFGELSGYSCHRTDGGPAEPYTHAQVYRRAYIFTHDVRAHVWNPKRTY